MYRACSAWGVGGPGVAGARPCALSSVTFSASGRSAASRVIDSREQLEAGSGSVPLRPCLLHHGRPLRQQEEQQRGFRWQHGGLSWGLATLHASGQCTAWLLSRGHTGAHLKKARSSFSSPAQHGQHRQPSARGHRQKACCFPPSQATVNSSAHPQAQLTGEEVRFEARVEGRHRHVKVRGAADHAEQRCWALVSPIASRVIVHVPSKGGKMGTKWQVGSRCTRSSAGTEAWHGAGHAWAQRQGARRAAAAPARQAPHCNQAACFGRTRAWGAGSLAP